MSKRSRKKQKNTFPRWLPIAGLVGVAVLAVMILAVMNGEDSESAIGDEVSVAEAADMRSEGAFILDVREPYEWDEVHIPGATLIPLGQLASRVSELPQDRDIVVVCRSGNRSADGRDILLNAGFERVTSMAGGMNQWVTAGYPTE